MQIVYAHEPALPVAEFRRVLVESGLGEIRPVDQPERLQQMLSAADLVLTARSSDGTLVGVARCLTDFAWCCFVSDLAVSKSAQGLGAGKGLLDEARRQVGPAVSVALHSVTTAVTFYEQAGMERVANAFWYRRER